MLSIRTIIVLWPLWLATALRPAPIAAGKPARSPLPKPPVSVSQTLAALKDNSAFYAALKATRWEVVMDAPEPATFTVFAPTNEAFARLSSRGYADMVNPTNKKRLETVVSFHIVSGKFPNSALKDGQLLPTPCSLPLTVTKRGGNMWVTGGTSAPVYVHSTPIICDNGIIYVIDDVLLPLVLRAK